jgi:type II secretory pathway component GspD/PulD (secretin)
MNARYPIAILALLLSCITVNAQFNPSRAEEQEIQRLLKMPDLTMRFQSAPLDDVLRTLCEASDMAYIGLPRPKDAPNVDMTIRGNPFQALQLVAETYGYVPLYENGLWHFTPIKEERSKLFPKVYKLKNLHLNEVAVNQDSLNAAASRDTSSALPQPVNSTAFASEPSKIINDIKALLELDPANLALNEKDAATPAVNPAALLLAGVPSNELAQRLGNVQPKKDEMLKGRIIADPDQNALFIIATKEHHMWIETYLAAIDLPRKLVLLETRFVEINNDPMTKIGIDWSNSLGEKGYDLTLSNANNATASSTTPVTTTDVAANLINTRLDTAILSGPELVATLHAIATDSSSHSLQHPSQVTVNNRQVVLRNVTQQPFQSGSSSTSGGGSSTATQETQFIPIGTTISLLPRILDDNNVELNIMINVSDMLGSQDIAGALVPITTSRDYTGQAIVATGNTLAIGGLDALHNTVGITKVPILGDIPIIGLLFRSETKSDQKSHLVMFITATILDGYSGGGVKSGDDMNMMLDKLDAELESRSKPVGSKTSEPATDSGEKKYLFD